MPIVTCVLPLLSHTECYDSNFSLRKCFPFSQKQGYQILIYLVVWSVPIINISSDSLPGGLNFLSIPSNMSKTYQRDVNITFFSGDTPPVTLSSVPLQIHCSQAMALRCLFTEIPTMCFTSLYARSPVFWMPFLFFLVYSSFSFLRRGAWRSKCLRYCRSVNIFILLFRFHYSWVKYSRLDFFLLQNIAKGGFIVVTAKKPGVTAGKFDAV